MWMFKGAGLLFKLRIFSKRLRAAVNAQIESQRGALVHLRLYVDLLIHIWVPLWPSVASFRALFCGVKVGTVKWVPSGSRWRSPWNGLGTLLLLFYHKLLCRGAFRSSSAVVRSGAAREQLGLT